ncbi:MAG: sulfite exporter TauE/SafE family protein [Elusimicrobia bacterium]|nr:sulfite exporter TauE/SafE family protein [Elusimicrobiota bacterium]
MDIKVLALTAASVGFFHTLLGPDHYVPFIAMAKARNWSYLKTGVITFVCGLGHVGSSVLLGFAGVYIGAKVTSLEKIESFRGGLAGWLLVIFGLLYFVWGLKKAYSGREHVHSHDHGGFRHVHTHSHADEHAHVHDTGKVNITPWILFTIFVFGPCEPLIPLIIYPAAKNSMSGVIAVTAVFSLCTISTMMVMVLAALRGIELLPVQKVERYSHALAGFAILMCGVAVTFMGL